MFNSQFNTQFNISTIPQGVVKWLIEFEWYDFMSYCESNNNIGTLILTWWDEHSIAPDIESFVSSLVDGGWIMNKKYGNKNISFNILIQGESYEDLIFRIDELKKYTSKVEWELSMKVLWKHRVYTATLSSLSVPSISVNENYCEIRISFLITSWTWKESDKTSEIVQVIWETEKIIFNYGTHEAFPIFGISCKSTGNAMTKININIRKLGELGGGDVYIEETITNNDLIIFDYQRAIVTLNSNEIQFYNPMTPLERWNNVITITPTWTANLEFSISYNKTYL